MKRIYVFSLSLLLLLSSIISSTNVFAEEIVKDSNFSYEDYQQLKEQGSVGEDVSYEYLKQIIDESKELEASLKNDPRYTKFTLTANTPLRSGDIIMTNSTIANGIIGHSGIASDYQNILHIPGYNELVRTDPISTFMNRYKDGWIDVYRYNDNLAGLKAARWAKDNYMNSNATYKITKNLTTTHETYCSKIVFQAYFYGIGQNTIHSSWLPVLNDTIMPPYSLPNVLSGGSYTLNYIGSL